MAYVEVLAPCGGAENLKVAISCGADAVYLGVSSFNARVNADNFTEDSLAEVVSKCHISGVKVYLTINILIKEKEYKALKNLIKVAQNAKVDAYIVQDLGVAHVIKSIDSNAVLHASTQLGVHNLYGAKVLEKMGFSRVVVSRETTLQDIKEIADYTNLEIESFVQGALCVSFSGGCYLSSLHNSNSGNRGRCQQLCRMGIVAKQNNKVVKQGYLLSATDLCYADSVDKLIKAGVTSLKIEGRMRSSLYVAEAVTMYRKLADGISVDKSGIAVAYNRGRYNEGAYFNADCGKIINPINQNHVGVEIGKVTAVKPFKDLYEIKLTSNRQLQKGDGLKFFDGNKEVASAGVGNIYGSGVCTIYSKAKVEVGNKVSIIFDNGKKEAFLKQAEQFRTKCNISCIAMPNENLQVTATCGNVSYTAISDYVVQQAENSATSVVEIEKQLQKTQGTPFEVENIKVQCGNVFIPKSVLNGARRQAIEGLTAKITAEYAVTQPSHASVETRVKTLETRNIFAVDSADMAKAIVLSQQEGILCIKPASYTATYINNIVASIDVASKNWDIALELPTYSSGSDLNYIENLLKELSFIKILIANNISCLQFLEKGYIILASSGCNIISNKTAEAYLGYGVSGVIASIEYRGKQQSSAITHTHAGGKLTAMTLRHCPYQVVFGGNCSNCKYQKGLTYTIEGRTYNVVRTKLDKCQFALQTEEVHKNVVANKGYYDLTSLSIADIASTQTSGYFSKEIK